MRNYPDVVLEEAEVRLRAAADWLHHARQEQATFLDAREQAKRLAQHAVSLLYFNQN